MCVVSAFSHRSCLYQALLVITLALTACSTNIPIQSGERPALPVASPLSAPTSTPTFHPTATVEATATVIITPTLPGNVDWEAIKIESGTYSLDHPDLYKYVETAFWSDDGKLVYYAFIPTRDGTTPLKWATYDVTSRLTTIISSPLKYDPGVWQRLTVPIPRSGTGAYPEVAGFVSPSGKHVIYPVVYGNPGPYGHDPSARIEIWIADSTGRHKAKLFKTLLENIHQAAWFKNETKVMFDLGYEGGMSLYIADVQNGTVAPFKAPGFEGETEERWALSPESTTLAVVDKQYRLCLVSVENGESRVLEKYALMPYWSRDSKRLYYMWGSSLYGEMTLLAYDVTSGNISTLVNRSTLDRLGVPLADYAVSPSGDKIVFWGGGLWLVELRK